MFEVWYVGQGGQSCKVRRSGWFGELSYRRLKVKVEKRKHTCPICSSELVKAIYLGKEPLVTDRSAFGYKAEFLTDLYDSDGSVRFAEVDSGCYAGE
jgi:hypothetical protein